MKRGRKKGSSLFAKPERAQWDEICKRIIYGTTEWPMVGLRQLIGDGSKVPDNFLSADYLTTPPALQKQEKAYRDKVESLWRPLKAQFERAVLNGDAVWFERQAKAIRKGGVPQRARFNAKVVHLIEIAWWGTDANRRSDLERAADELGLTTLTPAGKFTDAMASHIWKAVVNAASEEPEIRSLIEQQFAAGESYGFKTKKRQIIEQVVAENYGFKTKERAMDAIHDLATRLQFALKKQPRR
jgi:hypothetical protein